MVSLRGIILLEKVCHWVPCGVESLYPIPTSSWLWFLLVDGNMISWLPVLASCSRLPPDPILCCQLVTTWNGTLLNGNGLVPRWSVHAIVGPCPEGLWSSSTHSWTTLLQLNYLLAHNCTPFGRSVLWQHVYFLSTHLCGFILPTKWLTYSCLQLFAETCPMLLWLLPGLLWSGAILTPKHGLIGLSFLVWIHKFLTWAQACNLAVLKFLQALSSLIFCPT